jgi:hypothetical protein
MRAATRLAILGFLALPAAAALAQRTGALLHASDSSRKARGTFVENASAEAAARRDTLFAALVFDPSLAALARSSAWTASVVPFGGAKEVRIQANLCDIAGAVCGARGAASLMFAGPLSSSDEFSELADLDGLTGSARVQAAVTTNATGAGAYESFAATYAHPSFAYRDSTTLGRRSVDHALYSVEAGVGYRWVAAAVQGAVRWEHGYRARTSQNVCTPASFGPPGTQSCSNFVVGAPSDTGRTVAGVSAAWSVGGNAAMRLTLSRDFTHRVTGIDLPLWLVRNAAGGLAGGVRFGYRTDAKQVTAALFVSEFKL